MQGFDITNCNLNLFLLPNGKDQLKKRDNGGLGPSGQSMW